MATRKTAKGNRSKRNTKQSPPPVQDAQTLRHNAAEHNGSAAFHHATAAHHHRRAAQHTERGNHDQARRHHEAASAHSGAAQKSSNEARMHERELEQAQADDDGEDDETEDEGGDLFVARTRGSDQPEERGVDSNTDEMFEEERFEGGDSDDIGVAPPSRETLPSDTADYDPGRLLRYRRHG